jgi:hypothetical protein
MDTTGRIEFSASPLRMLGFGVLGLALSALSAGLAFRLFGGVEPGDPGQLIGFAGLIFFGLCTALILKRALSMKGAVVTIAPEGIRDVRVAAEFIPWSAVRRIATWRHSGQNVMVLAIDPAVEHALSLTRVARWSRSANARLGADGLCITANGLEVDYETLLATALAYAENS